MKPLLSPQPVGGGEPVAVERHPAVDARQQLAVEQVQALLREREVEDLGDLGGGLLRAPP